MNINRTEIATGPSLQTLGVNTTKLKERRVEPSIKSKIKE